MSFVQKYPITISVFVALGIIWGAVYFAMSGVSDLGQERGGGNNVVVENGRQTISIYAKGGYSPKRTVAQAGIPTVLKVSTKGTFDCSGALVIPAMDYRNNLPISGETLIELLPQKAGDTFTGLCAMGMYNFEISFK